MLFIKLFLGQRTKTHLTEYRVSIVEGVFQVGILKEIT